MSRTIAALDHVAELELAVEARGVKTNKAFRRHCSRVRYQAMCDDLAEIRAEAMAKRGLTWMDV